MEKLNFVANGVVRLPPGFRFHPTDEELVVQYLKRKVFSCPLPASIIPEVELGKFDPWNLPGNTERERYFFTKRESKYPNRNRASKATGSGFWKATGKDKQIVASRTNQLVGLKKVWVFYRGKSPKGSRTDWVMHEYRLSDSSTTACISPQRKNSMQTSFLPAEDWVLCRIFLRKRGNKDEEEVIRPCIQNRLRDQVPSRTALIDFTARRNTGMDDASSDSEASGITELSSAGSGNEEITSCNSLSSSSSPGREA